MRYLTAPLSIEFTSTMGAYEVKGDCLSGEDINDGSFLIIDTARRPESGDIVMCTIHSEPCVKKLLRRTGDGYRVITSFGHGKRNQALIVPTIQGGRGRVYRCGR